MNKFIEHTHTQTHFTKPHHRRHLLDLCQIVSLLKREECSKNNHSRHGCKSIRNRKYEGNEIGIAIILFLSILDGFSMACNLSGTNKFTCLKVT